MLVYQRKMIKPHPLAAPPSAASPSSGVLPRLRALRAAHPRARLVLAIDYDGTLTPIVADPAAARLAPAVRATLLALAALRVSRSPQRAPRTRRSAICRRRSDSALAGVPVEKRCAGWRDGKCVPAPAPAPAAEAAASSS
jgi:hypothetical protein